MSDYNEIDLGATNAERYGDVAEPSLAGKPDDKKNYPSFRYSGTKSLDLPKDGKMTVEFCVVEEVESSRNGKDHYECVIEVRKICDVQADDSDADEKPVKVEDILDGLMEKLQKEKE